MTRRNRSARVQQHIAVKLSDLLAYAERRVTFPADAADALGDALEIIWRKASRVPAEATPARMYMFGVMRNVLSNANRAAKHRSRATVLLAQELEQSTAPDPMGDSDLSFDIARAIASLPDAQAELVRLVHWDGFTIAEAAQLMHINASTARGRYASARRSLRAILDVSAVSG